MDKQRIKNVRRARRIVRTRRLVSGTTERPRLAIYKSLNHIYAQVIDDLSQKTLVAASTTEKALKDAVSKDNKRDGAKRIGQEIAKRCLEKGIQQVVFDRNGYIYHGRVSALAAGAREAGLKF